MLRSKKKQKADKSRRMERSLKPDLSTVYDR